MNTLFHHFFLFSAMASAPLFGTLTAATAAAHQETLAADERTAIQKELQSIELRPVDSAAPQIRDKQREFLEKADANADRNLTNQELDEFLRSQFNRMDRNGDGVVNMSDAPRFAKQRFESKVGPIIAQADANADQSMSYTEFSNGPLARFAALDQGDSGSIDLTALAFNETRNSGFEGE